MIRPQPMVVVADVAAASRWFHEVLGLTSGHGGAEYEMLMDGDEVVAQLHQWEADDVWLRAPDGYVVVAAGT